MFVLAGSVKWMAEDIIFWWPQHRAKGAFQYKNQLSRYSDYHSKGEKDCLIVIMGILVLVRWHIDTPHKLYIVAPVKYFTKLNQIP